MDISASETLPSHCHRLSVVCRKIRKKPKGAGGGKGSDVEWQICRDVKGLQVFFPLFFFSQTEGQNGKHGAVILPPLHAVIEFHCRDAY